MLHVDPGHCLEELSGKMQRRAVAGRGIAVGARIGLEECNQFGDSVLTGSAGLTTRTFGTEPIAGIGAKSFSGVVGGRLQDQRIERMRRNRAHQDRITIRIGPCDIVRRPDCRPHLRRSARSPAGRDPPDIFCARMRATTSVDPPAANGTTMVTCRSGKSAASGGDPATSVAAKERPAASVPRRVRVSLVIYFLLVCSCLSRDAMVRFAQSSSWKTSSRLAFTDGKNTTSRTASAIRSRMALIGRRHERHRIAAGEDHGAPQVFFEQRPQHEAEKQRCRLAAQLDQQVARQPEKGDGVEVVDVAS